MKDCLPSSLASFVTLRFLSLHSTHFRISRSLTTLHCTNKCPVIVDFPWSTCPAIITVTVSFPSINAGGYTSSPREYTHTPDDLRFNALRTSVSTFRRAVHRRPRRFPRGFHAPLRGGFPRGHRLRSEFLAFPRGTPRRFRLREGEPRNIRGTAGRFGRFIRGFGL